MQSHITKTAQTCTGVQNSLELNKQFHNNGQIILIMRQSAVQWTNGGVWPVPARSAELITPICQATMALTMPSLSNTHLFQTRVFPMATVSHRKTFLHYIVPVTCEN